MQDPGRLTDTDPDAARVQLELYYGADLAEGVRRRLTERKR